MKKKIIILVSIMLMIFTLVACGEESNGQGGSGESGGSGGQGGLGVLENKNEQIVINGKTYDLSKSCGEILQDLMDNAYIMDCSYDDREPIRKMEGVQIWDEELGIYLYEYHYYQLDENGEYVEMQQEDFDDRLVLRLYIKTGNTPQPEIDDLTSIGIGPHLPLNNSNLQVITPSGIQIGSTVEQLENAGGYKNMIQRYEMIYVDGKLVDIEDYREEAERIQQMDDEEWNQKKQSEYKYRCIEKEYYNTLNKVEEKERVMYLLARADAYSKLYTENKDAMIRFEYQDEDGKIINIGFTIIQKNDAGQRIYEEYLNSN